MNTLGTIRKFVTKNFIVCVTAEEEFDLDLSWDDTGETRRGLDNGELIAFCAHAQVIHRKTGAVLGDDYLGNCIYRSLDDFADHRECGRANRDYERNKIDGRCGSYFKDMIHESISEARKQADDLRNIKLRKVA